MGEEILLSVNFRDICVQNIKIFFCWLSYLVLLAVSHYCIHPPNLLIVDFIVVGKIPSGSGFAGEGTSLGEKSCHLLPDVKHVPCGTRVASITAIILGLKTYPNSL